MIGSPERVKFRSKVKSGLEVMGQKLSKMSVLATNGKIMVLNAQNFAISEFSRHIEYDFLKEDYMNNFQTPL